MIWEAYVLAAILGLIVATALYHAYLWPAQTLPASEPDESTEAHGGTDPHEPPEPPADARETA